MNDAEIRLAVKIDDSSATKSVDNIEGKVKSLQNTFIGVGSKLSLAVTAPITGLVAMGINYNKQMEQYQASLETMLGSTDKATKRIDEIKKFAAKTPFETADLMKAEQTMLAFGLSANKTQDYMQMLGDVSQGNKEKFSGLTLAFSQVQSTGRLMGQDLLQMINQGFNPLQIISEKTGRSMADLKKDMEKGAISSEMVADAFKSATSKGGRFYKAMDKQSGTTAGKMSTMTDAFNQSLGDLTTTLLPLFTNIVSGLTKIFTLFSSLNGPAKTFILILLGLATIVGPLMTIVGGFMALSGALSIGMLPLLAIIAGIALVITAIVFLLQNFDKIKKWFSGFFTFIKNIWNSIVGIFKTIGTTIANAISGTIKGVVNTILGWAVNIINGFIKAINLAIGTINKIPGVDIKKLTLLKAPKLATGTNYMPNDGLAYLHQGEAVVPKKYNPAMGGMQSITVQIPDIYLDGQKVSRTVIPYITKTVKTSGGNI